MANSSSKTDEKEFLKSDEDLSRWDNEGGAAYQDGESVEIPEMTNAELVHLRIRVIALENIIIALLAEGSERQLEIVREMANYISPQEDSTQHPLTSQAANLMTAMANRAEHFRSHRN
ncbi:hypothetical protein [Kangiella sp. M94]